MNLLERLGYVLFGVFITLVATWSLGSDEFIWINGSLGDLHKGGIRVGHGDGLGGGCPPCRSCSCSCLTASSSASPKASLGDNNDQIVEEKPQPSPVVDVLRDEIPDNVRPYFGLHYADDLQMEWSSECTLKQSMKAKSLIATSISSNHFGEMRSWLSLIQRYVKEMDNWEIVIFDLGLLPEQIKTIKSWCKVRYVKYNWQWLGFDESNMTLAEIYKEIGDLTNSVWKPPAIFASMQIMQKEGDGCGFLLYTDPSVRLYDSFFKPELLPTRAYKHGFTGVRGPQGSAGQITDKTSLAMLHALTQGRVSKTHEPYLTLPQVHGGFNMWRPSNARMRREILYPWIACARNNTCMNPPDAIGHSASSINRHCILKTGVVDHCFRGDQGVLSVLAGQYFSDLESIDMQKVFANPRVDNEVCLAWPLAEDEKTRVTSAYIVQRGDRSVYHSIDKCMNPNK